MENTKLHPIDDEARIPALETEHLLLRPFCESDAEAVRVVLDYGFNGLGLNLVAASCYPHNKRSQQVLERNGFMYEGILHQAELTYDGKVYDHLCYYLPGVSSLCV